MITLGARIAPSDAATITGYLAAHYGTSEPTAAAPAAQPPRTSPFPDGPGRDTLTRKCFQCHSQGMWRDLRQDRRAWEGVLYRMVGRGALWTEAEIDAMAGYLARVYGRDAAARP
jgi:hypothetical protein